MVKGASKGSDTPIVGSLGPSHQWRHKSQVSLRGLPCTHGVLGSPHGEVREISGVILDQILHLKVESLLVYIGWTSW